VPDLLYLIFGVILLILFGAFNGLTAITQEEVYRNITNNFTRFISSLIAVFVIGFFVGARLKSFKLVMIVHAVQYKSTHLWQAYRESAKFYWKIVALKVMSFLLVLIGVIFALVVYLMLEPVSPILAAVLAVLIVAAFFLSLFFREAALFMNSLEPQKAIGRSMEVFRRKYLSVLFIALVILLVNGFWISTNTHVPQQHGLRNSFLSLMYMVIMFFISAWSQLFVFNTYATLKGNKLIHVKKKRVRK